MSLNYFRTTFTENDVEKYDSAALALGITSFKLTCTRPSQIPRKDHQLNNVVKTYISWTHSGTFKS